MPHGSFETAHTILQLDIKSYDIIQGFVHFTKINVILYQIELSITIFKLY